jgi:penicillin-insensitive murein endopeptidase
VPAKKLVGRQKIPANLKARAIGTYAKGCLAGGKAIPINGEAWQVMRLSRNRNWGQPELVQFLVDLSRQAQGIGWRGLYIGDMSQPRGGPMTSGHASHQIGLDADVWMLPPRSLALSAGQRETLSSISVRTEDQRRVNGNWTAQHMALIRAAASDPRVDRVFVAAAVKIAMCNSATRRDRPWLQKVRPIAGHNYHFHVRLKCPAGSSACKTQSPTVAELSKGGDGCDATLNWWVTDYLDDLRKPPKKPTGPRPKTPREFVMADLPKQCRAVLASD